MREIPRLNDYARLADAILRASREISLRGHRDPQAIALSQTNVVVLRSIETNPGITPSEAARIAGLRRSNFSTALNELVVEGFVERRVHAEDGRSVHLYVTQKMLENFARVQQEWVQCMGEGLGEGRDVAQVAALLNELSEGLVSSRLAESQVKAQRGTNSALD